MQWKCTPSLFPLLPFAEVAPLLMGVSILVWDPPEANPEERNLMQADITVLTKVSIVRAMVFPVGIYERELDCKEGWVLKNWCFWIVVLKALESPLDSKEIKPVTLKGNHSWIFFGRTNAEAEASTFWPPDAKSPLIGKAPNTGKDWRQKEREAAEHEIVRHYHQLNGHKFDQTPGNSRRQRRLVCCSPWGRKELGTT